MNSKIPPAVSDDAMLILVALGKLLSTTDEIGPNRFLDKLSLALKEASMEAPPLPRDQRPHDLDSVLYGVRLLREKFLS